MVVCEAVAEEEELVGEEVQHVVEKKVDCLHLHLHLQQYRYQ